MTSREIMQELSQVRNALYSMSVCREQTLVVGGCIHCLDKLLGELNKLGAQDSPPENQ